MDGDDFGNVNEYNTVFAVIIKTILIYFQDSFLFIMIKYLHSLTTNKSHRKIFFNIHSTIYIYNVCRTDFKTILGSTSPLLGRRIACALIRLGIIGLTPDDESNFEHIAQQCLLLCTDYVHQLVLSYAGKAAHMYYAASAM